MGVGSLLNGMRCVGMDWGAMCGRAQSGGWKGIGSKESIKDVIWLVRRSIFYTVYSQIRGLK